jgi:lipopolysaccharide transport system permease protein
MPISLEVPEGMRDAIAEVLDGLYDAPYFGEGLTILDIGANVGAFTLWANLRWPGSRIYAYEPAPETFGMLLRNVQGLSNITCVNRAVYPSQAEREMFFSRYPGDGESGLAAVIAKIFEHLPEEKLIEVPVLHPADLPKADIVKLNTEGAEPDILGSMDLKNVSMILLEYHFLEDRERIKHCLELDFSLEYEYNFEWRALMGYEPYRRSLMEDSYGQLCFINKRSHKLRPYSIPGPPAPESKPEATPREKPTGENSSPDLTSRQVEKLLLAPADELPTPVQLNAQTIRRNRLRYLYDLLRTLVVRDMKLRYKRSVLGIAWSLFNPLAQLLVFGFVFSFVLPTHIQNYPLFLFTGIIAWNWFQGTLTQATVSIVENGELIRYPGFPVAILPMVPVTSHLIHFLIAIPVVILVMVLTNVPPNLALLALPGILGLQFILSLSLAYLVATLHVSFRDTQYLLGILLLLGFFLTPIFYSISAIPEPFRLIFSLNPMLHLINAYRSILLFGRLPDGPALIVLAVISLGLLLAGYRIFARASYRFVEEI